MLTQIKIYFLLFIIYSVMGWIMEVVNQIVSQKKFVNRGFLIGPYCPIYGCGAVLITVLLNKYLNDPITFFIMAILLCGILEYLTSYIMEKVFNLRWWDYSKDKFNINGRVSLRTVIPFGILGTIIMYVTNPFFLEKLNTLSEKTLNILFYLVVAVFFIDIVISLITIFGIKKTTIFVSNENKEDNTEEVTKKVRILNAYPRLRLIRIKVKKQINKTRKEINQRIDNTKGLIDDKIDKTKEEINKKIKKRK